MYDALASRPNTKEILNYKIKDGVLKPFHIAHIKGLYGKFYSSRDFIILFILKIFDMAVGTIIEDLKNKFSFSLNFKNFFLDVP